MHTVWVLILLTGSLPPGKDITIREFKTQVACERKAVELESFNVLAHCAKGTKEKD